MRDQRCGGVLIIAIGLMTSVPGCFYSPDRDRISEEEEDSETGNDSELGNDTDSLPDGGADGGGVELGGLGDTCYEDADCGEDGTSYCLKQMTDYLDPTKPGVCTIEDCEQGECPADYRCCDCSTFGQFCVPESMIDSTIEAYCKC